MTPRPTARAEHAPSAEFTCLVGTMVQEAYSSNPAIRKACEASISGHAHTLVADIAAAKRKYVPRAPGAPRVWRCIRRP